MPESRSPSRAPEERNESPAPQKEQQESRPPSQARSARGRSRSSRPVTPSWSQAPSDAEGHDDDSPHGRPQSRNTRRRRRQRNQGGMPGLDEEQDTGGHVARSGAGQAANTAGNAVQGGGQEKKEDKGDQPLRLRLDLNLEVELELTAKVHGDLTLALLQ